MTDRFDAQLRQHLLVTADDRPADGQLARVMDGVAATTQRRSATARLTWNPGRSGPFPSAILRYGLIALALALAAVVGASLGGGLIKPSSVFEGTWIAIDPADGSGLTLVVGPGPTPALYFEDGYASGLACVNDPVRRFTARGSGEISGNRIVATFPEGGGCGSTTVGIGGVYDYDQSRGTLTDQDGVLWTRALDERPKTPAPSTSPESPTPSPSPRPTPRPGEVTFELTSNGISIDRPVGWQTRSATEPWTSVGLDFDTAGADVIFNPEYGKGLYLAIASQPYGGLGLDGWKSKGYAWLCPEGSGFGFERFDGAEALVVACGSSQAAFIYTDTRGYLIRLGVDAPSDEPSLAETYDWPWFKKLLETVDLRPDDALNASFAPLVTASPDPGCIQFNAPGTYTAPADSLSLTVVMPGTVDQPWNGDRDAFDVMRASCTDWSGSGWIDAGVVTMVDSEACTGGRIVVGTTAEAIAAVSVAKGIDVIEQTDVTLDGYRGTRFDIMVRDVDNACSNAQIPLVDGVNPVDRGVRLRLYLIDVDGTPLAVGLFGYTGDPEVDAIIASMQIDP